MKKLALALALVLCMLSLVGCSEPVESERYISVGRYYTDGYIITEEEDGTLECWLYETDSISDKTPYDGMPIYVVFDDNGTGGHIIDDYITEVGFDQETAIYDQLETELSKSFELERDGNVIRIITE